MATPTRVKDFDTSNISFSSVKESTASGKRSVKIYNNKDHCILQIPKMGTPFGFARTDYGTFSFYNIGLSFETKYSSKEDGNLIKDFQIKMEQMDEVVISTALDYSPQWFGKELSRSQIEKMYRPILKQTNKDYPPSITIRVPTDFNGDFTCDFFDADKKEIEYTDGTQLLELIGKGSKLKAIVKCQGIWLKDDSFGVTWNLVQTIVYEKKQVKQLETYSFIDSDSDSEINSKGSSYSSGPDPDPEPTPVVAPTVKAEPVEPKQTAELKSSCSTNSTKTI